MLVSVAVILILFTTTITVFFLKFHQLNKLNHQDRFSMMSESLSDSISHLFGEHYNSLKVLSENLNLSVLSPQELQNKLNKEAARHEEWDLLLLVDPQGNYLSSNTFDSSSKSADLNNLKSYHFNTEKWYQSVINNSYSENVKLKGVFVTDVSEDSLLKLAYNDRRLSVSFSAPVKNPAGQLVAVLTARVNSSWYEKAILHFIEKNRNRLSQFRIQILNDEDFIILDFDSNSNHSSNQVNHDFDGTLLKKKLDKINNTPTPWYQSEKAKSGYFDITTYGPGEVYSYTPIRQDQFLNGLDWKVLVRSNASDVLMPIVQIHWSGFAVFFAFFLLSFLGAWWRASVMGNPVTEISQALKKANSQVLSVCEKLNDSTQQMSLATQSEARSLESTSSALAEISGMIQSNVHEVEQVNNIAQEVNQLTLDTQKWMMELTKAMQTIQESNLRITELVKIIEEIGEKTEIIDDIVFKTQLLSFNASVEAERAGEHGRGFSVVAQEVGNLAQLSGKAATEISSIVKKSIKEAEQVSKENKERVQRGEHLSQETYDRLSNVIRRVEDIFKSTSQIALASKEQGDGIQQITSNLTSISLESSDKKTASENYEQSLKELSTHSEEIRALTQKVNWLSGRRSA